MSPPGGWKVICRSLSLEHRTTNQREEACLQFVVYQAVVSLAFVLQVCAGADSCCHGDIYIGVVDALWSIGSDSMLQTGERKRLAVGLSVWSLPTPTPWTYIFMNDRYQAPSGMMLANRSHVFQYVPAHSSILTHERPWSPTSTIYDCTHRCNDEVRNRVTIPAYLRNTYKVNEYSKLIFLLINIEHYREL